MLESLFNTVAGLACHFIKKRPQHRYFPMKFAKFLRTRFFVEHLRWLLLPEPEKIKKTKVSDVFKWYGKVAGVKWVIQLLNRNLVNRCSPFIKKRLWSKCFPVNFAKFLRTPLLTEHLRWLLLYLY